MFPTCGANSNSSRLPSGQDSRIVYVSNVPSGTVTREIAGREAVNVTSASTLLVKFSGGFESS